MFNLDIVIPVYNEGSNIGKVFDALIAQVKTPFRVLICYDRDEDNTLPAIREYPKRDEIAVTLVKNTGKGVHAAVMSGFQATTAPGVLLMPADDDYNADMIDDLYQKLEEGCDIVVASRFIPGGCMVGSPPLKSFLVRSVAATLRHLARIPTHDPTNGFRLFSRRVVDQIVIESSQGFTFSIELLVKCHRLGWKIDEVPAKWFERTAGNSRFKVFAWAPSYLRWYFYAFATTYLRRGPETVPLKDWP
ncbi:MAG: glycosyltransferase family 2 protein [Thermodesulfobacteriota bacterium]